MHITLEVRRSGEGADGSLPRSFRSRLEVVGEDVEGVYAAVGSTCPGLKEEVCLCEWGSWVLATGEVLRSTL